MTKAHAATIHNERTKAMAAIWAALGLACVGVSILQPLTSADGKFFPVLALIGVLACCLSIGILGTLKKEP